MLTGVFFYIMLACSSDYGVGIKGDDVPDLLEDSDVFEEDSGNSQTDTADTDGLDDTAQSETGETGQTAECHDVNIGATLLQVDVVDIVVGDFSFREDVVKDFNYTMKSSSGKELTHHSSEIVCFEEGSYELSIDYTSSFWTYNHTPEQVVIDESTKSLTGTRICLPLAEEDSLVGEWNCEDEFGYEFVAEFEMFDTCDYEVDDGSLYRLSQTGHYSEMTTETLSVYGYVQFAIAEDGLSLQYYTEESPSKGEPVDYTEHGWCDRVMSSSLVPPTAGGTFESPVNGLQFFFSSR